MVRFMHTADWQIGIPARFLDPEARARYAAARVGAIRRLGQVAKEQGCAFVLVCGDVFDSNQLTGQTVRRALDALREVPVPVYLLPGNHDPLDAVSIYTQPVFTQEAPEHVHVLDRPGVHQVAPGVEIVAAPWPAKFPGRDLVAEALASVPEPAPAGTVRIVAGHGIVDELDRSSGRNPALIATGPPLEALAERRIHYVALGDRHSHTEVAGSTQIQYAGSPEPTAHREALPGRVLVVDLDPRRDQPAQVQLHPIATWSFVAMSHRVEGEDDLLALDAALEAVPDKDRTVLRLALTGALTVGQFAALSDLRSRHTDRFAALIEPAGHTDLAVTDDASEWGELGLSGFVASAVDDIRLLAEADRSQAPATTGQVLEEGEPADPGPAPDELTSAAAVTSVTPVTSTDDGYQPMLPDDPDSARDALALLYRLAGGAR